MKRKMDKSNNDGQKQKVQRSDRIQPIFDNQNLIKEWLLRQFIPKRATVLDIGVGKFGDMWKYKALDIQRLIGIDINQAHLDEGSRRLQECGSIPFQQRISFLRADLSKPVDSYSKAVDALLPDGMADVVVANFSIHYFFGSRDIAVGLFQFLAKKLKPGGMLIGTTVNGDALLSLLSSQAQKKEFKDDLLEVTLSTFDAKQENKDENSKNDYGQSVTMSIAESIIDKEHASHEFLVTPALLKTTAREAGLECINIWPFERIGEQQQHQAALFRRPLNKLSVEQARISHLFMAFAFRVSSSS